MKWTPLAAEGSVDSPRSLCLELKLAELRQSCVAATGKGGGWTQIVTGDMTLNVGFAVQRVTNSNCRVGLFTRCSQHPNSSQVGTFLASYYSIFTGEPFEMSTAKSPDMLEKSDAVKFHAEKQTIAVVDDDPDLVTILKLILEHNGFNVVCAYSGRQLFSVLETKKPHLIILDVMMPHMHGFEVLNRLKSNSETSSIPVILVTAKIQFENVLEGYKSGADYYIPKPFTKSQLMEGINRILNGDKKNTRGLEASTNRA